MAGRKSTNSGVSAIQNPMHMLTFLWLCVWTSWCVCGLAGVCVCGLVVLCVWTSCVVCGLAGVCVCTSWGVCVH